MCRQAGHFLVDWILIRDKGGRMPEDAKAVRKKPARARGEPPVPAKVARAYTDYLEARDERAEGEPWPGVPAKLNGASLSLSLMARIDSQIRALKAERRALKKLRKAVHQTVDAEPRRIDPADDHP